MGNHCSKCVKYTDASSPIISGQQRHGKSVELQSGEFESESPHLLPSSDSLEKIDVPSASGANSDPPASSSSENGNNYYVFLSFRGSDTRKGFVDHLYQRLKAVGLRCHTNPIFRDDEDLPFGENIGENLISAIERSKVSIPVISENYADSEWCLRELIHIMKCKESRGQMVLPVLYKMTPKDVRHLEGSFGKAFESCKDKFEEEVKQQGPLALRKAVDLRVFESEKFADGREGELVNELVEIILREQQHDLPPDLPVNLVAIEDCVAEVMELVDLACPDTRIIGIWGMGGIGKTTLATIIYKMLFDKFKCRSFLKDIRETINCEGIKCVQSLLLSDIRKGPKSTVHDPGMGINMIRLSCEKKKVLILLDDMDHPNHLDNLIGDCKFLLGSRIIFTSRHKNFNCQDKALLESTYWYELRKMNIENSLLLFSIHAFEKKPPPKQLATLSRDIVAIIGGLPLALTVIGSRLKGEEDQRIWGEMLEKLRDVPDEKVQQQLRISYELLEDDVKKMFLDIACFFTGIDKRIAPYLWDHKLCPRNGLKELIDRSLIYVDDENELGMHNELRNLGRALAHPADKKPWDCSRLWKEEDMIVLSRKKENENIEALRLDERGSREFIERESFKKMPNLEFLHLNAVGFAGDFEGSLSELRWLKWEGCHNSFEATNVHLEKLAVLDLSSGKYTGNCYISENWRGWSSIKMERLKVLNLSWCLELKSTPNLSAFKDLELLILQCCTNLKEIDPSIGDVKHLIFLNLSRCERLEKLPEKLGELKNLEELVIDETRIIGIPPFIGSLKKLKRFSARKVCWQGNLSFEQIPSSIVKLVELVELNLSNTKVKELPEFIGELTKLKILDISGTHIERLPSSIGKLQSLQKLDAFKCYNLEGQILVDKGGLSSLKTLNLHSTKISGLPENLDKFSSLEYLDLSYCEELKSLPKPPFSLSSMWVTCRSNELPSLSHLKHLQKLDLSCCNSLQSIPSLSHLKHLQELTLHDCESLQSIPSLSHLKHLHFIMLWHCESLQSIPELPSCIRTLNVKRCPKLERLPNLSDLEFLWRLKLCVCSGLKQLDGLESLKSLRELDLSLHYNDEADNLQVIRGLEKLGSLDLVDISDRGHIQELDLSKSEHLKWLIVSGCKSLVEIHCPSKFLKLFKRDNCESLKKFPDFLPHDSCYFLGKKQQEAD